MLQSGNGAEVYAEGILNVCKFYVESPLACASGVSGADLKKRIVRIMTEHGSRRLALRRKLLLGSAGVAAVALPVLLGLTHVHQVRAQASAPAAAQDIAATWQGTLHVGQELRIVLKVDKAEGGGYTAHNYSIDQGGQPIPVDKITLDGTSVKFSVKAIGGSYSRQVKRGRKNDCRRMDSRAQSVTPYFQARNAGDGMEHSEASASHSAHGGRCQSFLRSRDHQADQAR